MKQFPVQFFSIFVAIFLSMLFIFPTSVHALEMRNGDSLTITEDIDGSLFVSGQMVVVDGNVEGNVFCAGQDITINGAVDGDVFCAGQYITVNGNVEGSIISAGQRIEIDSLVSRNVIVAGQTMKFAESSLVERDVVAAGQTVNLQGAVSRDALLAGQRVDITGSIDRDLTAYADELVVGGEAVIAGTVEYTSENDIMLSDSAAILGGMQKYAPENANFTVRAKVDKNKWKKMHTGFKASSFVVHIVLGVILILLFPEAVRRMIEKMLKQPGRTGIFGFLFFMAIPISILLLLVSIIGIPIALLGIFIFILALFYSRILAALAIGQILTERFWKKKATSIGWVYAIGMIASWIVFTIPFVGWIGTSLAVIWGLGGVIYLIRPKA